MCLVLTAIQCRIIAFEKLNAISLFCLYAFS
jgi:hypothetical protein